MHKKITVLVAEDEQMLRDLYVEALQAQGFSVLSAVDGVEALEQVKQHADEIDLIVLDLLMPRRDGFEVLEALNNNEIWKNIPVIVATNLNEESDKAKALALGANEYIVKLATTPQALATDIASICCSRKGAQRKRVTLQ